MPTRAVNPFKPADWFTAPVLDARRSYPPQVPPMIHGVYAIADLAGRVLYVGESHTGRLRETLTRHLRRWFKEGQWQPHYDRAAVQIAWRQTPTGEEAQIQEALLIAHYKPRDNTQLFVFEEADEANERELTPEEAAAVDAVVSAVEAGDVPF